MKGQRPTAERVSHKTIVVKDDRGRFRIESGFVLTPRLEQTLRGLGEGLTQPQIAQRIGISKQTVNHFVVMLMRIFEVDQWSKLTIIGYQMFREQTRD